MYTVHYRLTRITYKDVQSNNISHMYHLFLYKRLGIHNICQQQNKKKIFQQ